MGFLRENKLGMVKNVVGPALLTHSLFWSMGTPGYTQSSFLIASFFNQAFILTLENHKPTADYFDYKKQGEYEAELMKSKATQVFCEKTDVCRVHMCRTTVYFLNIFVDNKIVKLTTSVRNLLITNKLQSHFKNCARIKSMRNYSIKNKRTKIGKNPS